MEVFKSEALRTQVLSSYDEILRMWDTDVEAHDVYTSYGITHCLTAGNPAAPPLMLFHGVGDNSALMWALNMKTLARHFYCIAVDTLGGPGKSKPNTRFTRAEFEQTGWINELAQHFDLHTFQLAGVSNGAHIAYHYTVACPERVLRTLCLEGGPVQSPIKAMISTLMLMFPEMLIPTDHNVRKIIRKLSSPSSDVFDRHPLLEDHLVLLMKSHNQRSMFPHRPHPYDREADRTVRDKLYFLLGDHSTVVRKDLAALLGKEGYRHSIIPQAGHAINHEQPERVHQEMLSFLLGNT